ncbi:glycosyltransferase [Candidatus Pelagibacter sp.]|nr:glycosyltransferase [Candidatus Pelagibacter sp.]
MKKIYYWSPFLSPIATCKAVINSAGSLVQFGSHYESYILNFYGEFNKFDQEIKKKKIELIGFYNLNIAKFLPYKGKIKSRCSFLIIFLLGFFPLIKVLKKNKPDFLIVHLITSLPLILLLFFNFKTKFILRISGYPRMNFLRRILWRMAFKKIYLVTCPTKNTQDYLKSLNLVDSRKIKLLYDPIIDVKEINKKKQDKIDFNNFFLSVGRLTKQKNFMFLCQAFKKLVKKNNEIKLLIAGNGEEKKNINNFITKNNLQKNIILLGYVNNIYPYFRSAKGFILSSLWEDPGFVLLEASFCRTLTLSSNAWPGPVELIKDNFNGILFESNNMESFLNKFSYLNNNLDSSELKLNNLKLAKRFTIFNHYKSMVKLIN